MDKNKFWLGGRLFNTTSPRLVAPTQRKARPQVGRPTHVRIENARHVCTSASWAPQRNARHVRLEVDFLIRPHQVWVPQRNATHVHKMGAQTYHKARPQVGHPNTTQGTSASWAPQHNARHVRKLGAPTHVRNANAKHVRTSASWAPQRNARHIRKMVSQAKNSSARKTSTQGSTRLKDELEDG
jgi:hypothetical protein